MENDKTPSGPQQVAAGQVSQGAVRPFLLAMLFLALALAGYILWPFLNPLILGIVLASVAHPAQEWLARKLGGRPNVAALCVVAGIMLLIVIPALLLLSMLTVQGIDVVNDIAAWVKQVDLQKLPENPWVTTATEWLDQKLPFLQFDMAQARQQIVSVTQTFGQFLLNTGTSILGNVAGLLINFVIMMFVCFHFLRDGRAMLTTAKLLSPLREDQEERILERIRGVIRSVLLGTFLTSLSQGVLAAVGMSIVGIPALFWGTMLAMASTVPMFGTALVWIPIALYLLVVGQYKAAIFWALWASLLVGSIDNFLRPVFMQGPAKMSTFYIFLGLIGGLRVFGLMGLLYGPLIMALATVMLYIYRHEYHDLLSQMHPPGLGERHKEPQQGGGAT